MVNYASKDYNRVYRPFGIYSRDLIIERFGEVPSTARRIGLPARLERILGELYIIDKNDKRVMRTSTTGGFIESSITEAERVRHELAQGRW